MNNIGERLRALREGAKLSQAKVAEYIGTNQPSVGRYENGNTAPPLDVLTWYADFFGVSLDWIFGRRGAPADADDWSANGGARGVGHKPVIVRDIILESVNAHPDLTAYMYKNSRTEPYQHVTYRETADTLYALGAQLVEMGLKGKRIAVIGDNCFHWAIAYFAVLFGVGVVVPLDKELRAEEIINLLKVAECSAIFHTERYDEMLADVDFVPFKIRMNIYADTPNPEGVLTAKGLIAAGKTLSKEKIDAFRATPIDENALAALLFTSGTTGNAKGVMLSNRGMGTNISDMAGAHNAKPGGSTVSILPMHHCFEAVMGQQFMLSNGVAIAFGDGLKY
ncbi:MAG: AMP-binding protein, partial [Clostridiales Family XIII bacterium]|nr:AMP-binding protein [Clostridiales Family XIII bacterium]